MPPAIDPASPILDCKTEGIVDRTGDDILREAFEAGFDRLPLNVAMPIVLALNLSLWVGIGFAIRALL